MTRLGSFVATCAVGLSALIGVAHYAEADNTSEAADKAKQANTLMFADPPQYEKSIDLYQQAIVLDPQGKYYLNLCVAYYSIGEFGLALQTCDAVQQVSPNDATLLDKTKKMTGKVEDQIRAMGKDPDALRRGETGTGTGTGTGTDTGSASDVGTGTGSGTAEASGTGGGHGEGSGSNLGTGAPVDTSQFRGAPPPSLLTAKPPSHDYVWSVGGELYGFGGTYGNMNTYGKGGAGFRLHADYMVVPKLKLGVQGYLAFNSVSANSFTPDNSLSIVDFGAAGYMHVVCPGRLCVTPLAGLQVGGLQPSQVTGNQVRFATLGVRLELGLSYAFGSQYEHVISLTPGFMGYLPATGDDGMGNGPAFYDLNHGGNMFYFGIGYTHRFDTPFGQAPFITLE